MGIELAHFDPSLALKAILDCNAQSITTLPGAWPSLGLQRLSGQGQNNFQMLEALAQTCGMHLRFCHDFRVMAYLVSVENLVWPMQTGLIRAQVTARTTAGAKYLVQVEDGPTCGLVMGWRNTDDASLGSFFRERFVCLRNASSKD